MRFPFSMNASHTGCGVWCTPYTEQLLAVVHDVSSNKLLQLLEVACWPLVPKFAGSNPAEAVGFLRAKNPQHAFLQRGSKAVGPMSQSCGM
jgi:hypothetical protein